MYIDKIRLLLVQYTIHQRVIQEQVTSLYKNKINIKLCLVIYQENQNHYFRRTLLCLLYNSYSSFNKITILSKTSYSKLCVSLFAQYCCDISLKAKDSIPDLCQLLLKMIFHVIFSHCQALANIPYECNQKYPLYNSFIYINIFTLAIIFSKG